MDFKHASQQFVTFAEENKAKWNELDGAQGDGDLGVTLTIGAHTLANCAEHCHTLKEWLEVGGKSLRKAAPSTMGILVASAFIYASKQLEEGNAETSVHDWVVVQQAIVEEIQKRGGASLGDKTILDALIPAVEAFSIAIDAGENTVSALTSAAQLAKQGAERTRDMISKTGRSSWLGERAKGHIDGGAWACYQIYDFILNEVKQHGAR